MKINKLLESKSIRESNDKEILFQRGNKKIIKDGYGYGIEDDNNVTTNRFYVNDKGEPKFEDGAPGKFWLDKVNSLIKSGKITGRKNEGYSHFEFTSGSNPYIAKTKNEVERIKRSRGDSVRYVGNINGIDYYKVDDSEKDLFRVDDLDEGSIPRNALKIRATDRMNKKSIDLYKHNKYWKDSEGEDYNLYDPAYLRKWNDIEVLETDPNYKPNRTKPEYVVQGNYGYGWEDLTASDSQAEARNDLKAYRENETGVPHRLITRRVPVTENLKEAFKPSDSGIQSVKCYNRYNYTIQELRVDNDKKTFERGNFTAGKADKKVKNRQEYEDIVDSLKELGYTEIKSDYRSMRNKSRKGNPTNESKPINESRPDKDISTTSNKVTIKYGNSDKEAETCKPIKVTSKQLQGYKDNYSFVDVLDESKSIKTFGAKGKKLNEANELSTEHASVSIVDDIKTIYELGGFEKLPVGRENAFTKDICGPDKDRLVGYFKKQSEFNYEMNTDGGIISHEFISDKYDIEIFDSFIQMYKISQNESLSESKESEESELITQYINNGEFDKLEKVQDGTNVTWKLKEPMNESIEVATIADYIVDHYDFDDIDDKYSCINSIRDSFKNEKTISKEELEQFIGSHNGKDKVSEGYEMKPNIDISWRPYDNEKGQVMADKWYASRYPDDEIGIEQLRGITLDDALKDRSILGHCDTQVRERVYAQLDKYIPLSKESPMYKEVNEASYGGAFDIADDQYFTREDLDSFAEEVLNHINETFKSQFDVSACYMDDGVLELEVTNNEYGDYIYSEKIDMRKIKEPWHLKRAYAFEFASQLINDITQSNDGLVESYDDDVDDLSYYYSEEDIIDALNDVWEEKASKSVPDSDGFMTDYTMYRNINTGEYVFVFGDKDIYRPEDGYFDWECETEEEAEEWFNNYNGFEESEFDDFEESYETEKVFSAACNNRMDYMKKGFAKGKINPNDRFNRFNSDHSYIMGALRNGNVDMVKYLQDQGGTILDDEQQEYDYLMDYHSGKINEDTNDNQSPIVHKKPDGSYLVAAENGEGYVAYNRSDVCMGNITANNDAEAKSKFNSNKFDD